MVFFFLKKIKIPRENREKKSRLPPASALLRSCSAMAAGKRSRKCCACHLLRLDRGSGWSQRSLAGKGGDTRLAGVKMGSPHSVFLPAAGSVVLLCRIQSLSPSRRCPMATWEEEVCRSFPAWRWSWDGMSHMEGDEQVFWWLFRCSQLRSLPGL